jgi:Zn-finger protein
MDCPGNYKMVEKNGKLVKSCIDCIFPHVPENYDLVMELLRKR